MKITDKSVRYLVAGIITILIFGLSYSSFTGKKQDEKFLNGQITYNQALQYIEEEKYDQALPILKLVAKEYPSSSVVRYYLGSTFAIIGEWKSAAQEYQQILDLNPYMVEDPTFMIQFGNILINAEKLDEAKVVLERCKQLSVPDQIPDYLDQVKMLLMQIPKSS